MEGLSLLAKKVSKVPVPFDIKKIYLYNIGEMKVRNGNA